MNTISERRSEMIQYPQYKKVLFCTDFSENADHAFEYAYGIAQRNGGLLYIFHVVPRNPNQDFAEGLVRKEVLEKIDKAIEEDIHKKYQEHYVQRMGNGVAFEIVTKYGREHDEIIKFAKEERADIIVMGSHGITGIARVYFGSVAEKVIRKSPFPVFTIPCKKKLEFAYGVS
jgi:nucleotide-binding universal stress UspA family protein